MSDSIRDYEEKMYELVGLSSEQMPGVINAFKGPVAEAVYSGGALDVKTKRLVSLGIAVQAGCKNCTIAQTSMALEQGATVGEIMEVCSAAISMGGTLAWSKSLVVVEYLQEKGLLGD